MSKAADVPPAYSPYPAPTSSSAAAYPPPQQQPVYVAPSAAPPPAQYVYHSNTAQVAGPAGQTVVYVSQCQHNFVKTGAWSVKDVFTRTFRTLLCALGRAPDASDVYFSHPALFAFSEIDLSAKMPMHTDWFKISTEECIQRVAALAAKRYPNPDENRLRNEAEFVTGGLQAHWADYAAHTQRMEPTNFNKFKCRLLSSPEFCLELFRCYKTDAQEAVLTADPSKLQYAKMKNRESVTEDKSLYMVKGLDAMIETLERYYAGLGSGKKGAQQRFWNQHNSESHRALYPEKPLYRDTVIASWMLGFLMSFPNDEEHEIAMEIALYVGEASSIHSLLLFMTAYGREAIRNSGTAALKERLAAGHVRAGLNDKSEMEGGVATTETLAANGRINGKVAAEKNFGPGGVHYEIQAKTGKHLVAHNAAGSAKTRAALAKSNFEAAKKRFAETGLRLTPQPVVLQTSLHRERISITQTEATQWYDAFTTIDPEAEGIAGNAMVAYFKQHADPKVRGRIVPGSARPFLAVPDDVITAKLRAAATAAGEDPPPSAEELVKRVAEAKSLEMDLVVQLPGYPEHNIPGKEDVTWLKDPCTGNVVPVYNYVKYLGGSVLNTETDFRAKGYGDTVTRKDALAEAAANGESGPEEVDDEEEETRLPKKRPRRAIVESDEEPDDTNPRPKSRRKKTAIAPAALAEDEPEQADKHFFGGDDVFGFLSGADTPRPQGDFGFAIDDADEELLPPRKLKNRVAADGGFSKIDELLPASRPFSRRDLSGQLPFGLSRTPTPGPVARRGIADESILNGLLKGIVEEENAAGNTLRSSAPKQVRLDFTPSPVIDLEEDDPLDGHYELLPRAPRTNPAARDWKKLLPGPGNENDKAATDKKAKKKTAPAKKTEKEEPGKPKSGPMDRFFPR
ncbi:hypothetical protein DFJ74DRAFT_702999 [Hyaloraphidium curvatum]|nr:hypothetical protein DFJ74DRAFT_702999 [Hyaloraphidium curvatum]